MARARLHIGQQGGTTIEQSSGTASYPSMPKGTVNVGKARHILTPKAIAALVTTQTSE